VILATQRARGALGRMRSSPGGIQYYSVTSIRSPQKLVAGQRYGLGDGVCSYSEGHAVTWFAAKRAF